MRNFAGFSLAVLLVTGPVLSGCGFTPLYARPDLNSDLSAIAVKPLEGRLGFLLQQAIQGQLMAASGQIPRYELSLSLQERRKPRGLGQDNIASRYELTVIAEYVLTDTRSSAQRLKGSVRSQVSFEASNQPYAGIIASDDAERRVAEDLARQIQTALAVGLRSSP
jgi:LPS-assembly lipoprotein